ncbi:hypothetical protein C2M14_23600 [Enterobacter cloacae]|nr:hypothetical protein C2M14_23600 [Enterobacter cloacae]
MVHSCCLFTIVNRFQARCFIGTDNRCRILDKGGRLLPGGAALTGPTIVGRVRRSRHPATRAQG